MKYQIINKRFTDSSIALLLTIVAASIRLPGLGKWCLTSDEFFLFKPVVYILQKGIPEFPGGGYYVRGLLLQYLIAIPLAIFHNKEFALRLFPLIFGVLTIHLFYIFCRKFMDKYPSFICSLILVLSSWHIEFSRFGRFYTAFQFLFILFIYLFHTGYWENSRKYQIASWVVALITIFVFEASIFIPLIIITFVCLRNDYKLNKRLKIELLFGSIVLFIMNIIVNMVNYTSMGVSNLYPIGYERANAGSKMGPIVFPSFDLHKYIYQHNYLIYLYAFIIFSSIIMYYFLIKKNRGYWEILFSTILVILSLMHQYALLFLATIIFILNRKEIKNYLQENKKTWIIYCIYTLGFWIFVTLSSGNYNKILHYLVGYPPIKKSIIIPYFNAVPKWSILYFGIIIYSTVKNVFKNYENINESIFLLNIIYLCIVVVAFFHLIESTTRYSYFFFPLVIMLGFIELKEIFTNIQWPIQKSYLILLGNIIFTIPLIIFMFTEDFHTNHILDVSSREANFRIGKYSRFYDHWFERFDNKTPAQYVNLNFRKGDVVMIDSIVVSEYLNEKAYFQCDINTTWFHQFSRKFGTEEKFTGLPLTYRESSIMELIPKEIKRSLWFITTADIVNTNIWGLAKKHNLNIILRQNAIDGRLKVWQIGYKG